MARATTRPVKGKTILASENTEVTTSIRKIENGWIIRTSSFTKRGGHKEIERFSETRPTIETG